MKEHHLKILPKYFGAVENGTKNFEVRFNDRDFEVGDILYLEEFDTSNAYTGLYIRAKIGYVLNDENFLKEGYVILGFTKICYC